MYLPMENEKKFLCFCICCVDFMFLVGNDLFGSVLNSVTQNIGMRQRLRKFIRNPFVLGLRSCGCLRIRFFFFFHSEDGVGSFDFDFELVGFVLKNLFLLGRAKLESEH